MRTIGMVRVSSAIGALWMPLSEAPPCVVLRRGWSCRCPRERQEVPVRSPLSSVREGDESPGVCIVLLRADCHAFSSDPDSAR